MSAPGPRIKLLKCLGAAALGMIGAAIANAETSSRALVGAIRSIDTQVLQAAAVESSTRGQMALARGVLSEFAGEDAAAIRQLRESIHSGQLEPAEQLAAFDELGSVYMRGQRYSPAAAAFASALKLARNVDLDEAPGLERAWANARAFSGAPPMTEVVLSHEDWPLIPDAMNLPRASVEINGHPADAILDTGAANSVVSVSTASRLHLRILRLRGGVTSAGIGRLAAQFAIADTLRFAGHGFRNVPFIVLPDEALTVPIDDGMGRLEPIIGLSVLRRLGRLEILRQGGGELLRVGGEDSRSDGSSNLILAGTLPLVLLAATGDGTPTPLRMALDTGANRSALAPAAITAHSHLAVGATLGKSEMAGAGGTATDERATIVPRLTLKIGQTTRQLLKVPVATGPENCDGTLGQDALRAGRGYVIDFVHMRLELLPGD